MTPSIRGPETHLVCQELVELVTSYLEGRLLPQERARFEQHVHSCEPCGIFLEQMRQTIRAVGTLSDGPLAPEVRQRLLRLFRDWQRARLAAPAG